MNSYYSLAFHAYCFLWKIVCLAKIISVSSIFIRQTRCVYARGNLLTKTFRHCSEDVKVKLFKSYCTSFYCCYLWAKFHYKCRGKLVLGYKQIFRSFFHCNLLGTTSHIINVTIDSYDVILLTCIYSFNTRLNSSDNIIVVTIVNALYFRSTHIQALGKHSL